MTATAEQCDTRQLAALIGAKLQLVEILAKLGNRQLTLIGSGEMTQLVKLLAAKQTVLAQMRKVEQQLDPYRQEDPERRAWASGAERAACQGEAERCNALLAETIDLEKQAETAMLRRRDATTATLASANTAADARSAYGAVEAICPTRLHVEG